MQESLDMVFAGSWKLLNRNWVIVVPGLIVAVVASAFSEFELPAFFGSAVVLEVLIAELVTISYTTGMAAAAWQRGAATMGDGAAPSHAEAGKS